MKYNTLKRTVLAMLIIVSMIIPTVCIAAPYSITMYAPDGRTEQVNSADVEAWKSVGWYDYPVMYVYAMDGRSLVVKSADLSAWKAVGWYETNAMTMYTLDGRSASVQLKDVQAWQNVGWYTCPVAELYSADGRTIIVPLDKVYEYSKVGWYTMVDFVFGFHFAKTKLHFGPFNYELYYEGIPNSGDVARTYYTGAAGNPLIRIAVDNYSGRYAALRLADAFPYLALYADANGNISLNTVNAVLGDGGIYGKGYRSVGEIGVYFSFSKFVYDDTAYWGDYDCKGVAIDNNGTGMINIYTDICHFNDLT